jgi:redox-sensitive bicupin YhaK (pirin superfamily)
MKYIIAFAAIITSLTSCLAQGTDKPDDASSKVSLVKGQYVIHKADSRGESRADWLLSKHTFSFNDYYDPTRVGFGALLVLNDDWVKAGGGFPSHHHEEMEIISIPLIGGVAHKDSKGSSGVTSADRGTGVFNVQKMTAGSGIAHSEFNVSNTDSVRFLQIWVLPNKRGLTPVYQQKQFEFAAQHNKWQTLISSQDSSAISINQDAVFSIADLDAGTKIDYALTYAGGVYAFILEGNATVNGADLDRRDGIGIVDVTQLSVTAKERLQILVIEVPVKKIQ